MSGRNPLVRCDGVARTFGEGATATVALQPTDCEVFAGSAGRADRPLRVGQVHALAPDGRPGRSHASAR